MDRAYRGPAELGPDPDIMGLCCEPWGGPEIPGGAGLLEADGGPPCMGWPETEPAGPPLPPLKFVGSEGRSSSLS